MLQPPGSSTGRRPATAASGPSRRGKTVEETPDDVIRQLQRLPPNKRCCDCGSKLPSCVNLTVGSFVCMTCAGIHREMSQKIKGVGHSTFTPEDVELLRHTDNDKINVVYMARYNSISERVKRPEDNSDSQLLKAWIHRKYQDKAWYSDALAAAAAQQQKQSQTSARSDYTQPTVVQIPPKTESFDAFGSASSGGGQWDAFGGSQQHQSQQPSQQWDAFGGSQQQKAPAFEANFANFNTPQQQPPPPTNGFPADFGSSQIRQEFVHAPPTQQTFPANFAQMQQPPQQQSFQPNFPQQPPAQQPPAQQPPAQQFQPSFPQQPPGAEQGFQANFSQLQTSTSQLPPPQQQQQAQPQPQQNFQPSFPQMQQQTQPQPPSQQQQNFQANFSQMQPGPQPAIQATFAPMQTGQPVPQQGQTDFQPNFQQMQQPPQQQPGQQGFQPNFPHMPQQTTPALQGQAGLSLPPQQGFGNFHAQQQGTTSQSVQPGFQQQQQIGQPQQVPSTPEKSGDKKGDPFAHFDNLQQQKSAFKPVEPPTPSQSVDAATSGVANLNVGEKGTPATTSKYKEGQTVYYKSASYVGSAKILKVHLDDALQPFYTISVNGKEKQTDDAHLAEKSPLQAEIEDELFTLTDDQLKQVKDFIGKIKPASESKPPSHPPTPTLHIPTLAPSNASMPQTPNSYSQRPPSGPASAPPSGAQAQQVPQQSPQLNRAMTNPSPAFSQQGQNWQHPGNHMQMPGGGQMQQMQSNQGHMPPAQGQMQQQQQVPLPQNQGNGQPPSGASAFNGIPSPPEMPKQSVPPNLNAQLPHPPLAQTGGPGQYPPQQQGAFPTPYPSQMMYQQPPPQQQQQSYPMPPQQQQLGAPLSPKGNPFDHF